jgi:putative peptide zinc metalloprotease protein
LRSSLQQDSLVLNNPQANTYLMLSGEERFLWQQMDGQRSVRDLIVALFNEYHLISPAKVMHLVRSLAKHGMLTGGDIDVYRLLDLRLFHTRSRGLLTHLTALLTGRRGLRLPEADRCFAAAHRASAPFLFSPLLHPLLLGVALTGLGSFIYLLASPPDGFGTGGRASALGALGLLLVLQLSFLLVHEISHGLACRQQGCRVNGAGLIFFYGMPCFYVDTTDVWMTSRRGRISTSWAGPFSGFVAAGGLSLTALAANEWAYAPVLVRVALFLYFGAAFNLIPFVQMDGYYMVVDWLGIPMLRPKALSFLRKGLPTRLRTRTKLSRQEKLFVGYGAISAVVAVAITLMTLSFWKTQLSGLVGVLWGAGWGGRLGVVLLVTVVGMPLVQAPLLNLHRQAVRVGRAARGSWTRSRLSIDSDIELLVRTDFVAPLSYETAKILVARLRRQSYRAGELVIQEGDRGEDFYLIRDGEAEVFTTTGDRERSLALLGPGDYFGELALLERAPRAASVRALARLHVLVVSKGDFDRLLAPHIKMTATVDRIRKEDELRRVRPLAGLSASELSALRGRLDREANPVGSEIVTEGEPGDRFYIIESGQVEVVKGGTRVAILGADDTFGETALVEDCPRTATVRALTPVSLYSMGRETFDEFLRKALHNDGRR